MPFWCFSLSQIILSQRPALCYYHGGYNEAIIPPASNREYYGNISYYWDNYEELKKSFENKEIRPVVVISDRHLVGHFDTVADAHCFIGEKEISPRAYVAVIGDEETPFRVLISPRHSTGEVSYTSAGFDYRKEGPLTNGRGPYQDLFGSYIYGPDSRLFIVLPVKTKSMDEYLYVDFFVDTGAPVTTITDEVRKQLGLVEDHAWILDVGPSRIPVVLSTKHYTNICLLGASFLRDKLLIVDYINKKVDIKKMM